MKNLILFTLTIILSTYSTLTICQCVTTCTANSTFMGLANGANGPNNSFYGAFSGFQNSTGEENSFFGTNAGGSNSVGSFNSYFGKSAAESMEGNRNTLIGASTGAQVLSGSNNIFLGYNAGPTGNVSSRLFIDVTQSDFPLIYGEFDNDLAQINGALNVTGDMGVGTTVPGAKLHINSASTQIPIRADIAGQMKFHVSTNGGASIGTQTVPPVNGLLVSGQVAIGNITAAQKLDVDGGIRIGNSFTNPSGSIRYTGSNFQGSVNGTWVNLDNDGPVWSLNGNKAFYNADFVGIGTSNPTQRLHVAGNLAVSGSIVAPSDRRLKTDINGIDNALEIVANIEPCTYHYEEEKVAAHGMSSKIQYGMIAQELEKVLPSVVIQDALKDEDGTIYKGIEYGQLIPILTQAIKELSDENAILKKQYEDQVEQTASIQKKFARLESAVLALQNAQSN